MNSHLLRAEDRDDEVGDGTTAFTSTKPFEPARLDAEITKAHNWRKQAGLVVEGDPALADDDNPITFWVIRGDDVETDTVRSVLADHEQPTEEDRLLEASPFLMLVRKARAGEHFTDDEVDSALAIVLNRMFPEADA